MPVVKKFCCYNDLRTGGLIIGLFGIVTYVLAIIAFSLTQDTVEHQRNFLTDKQYLAYKILVCIIGISATFSLLWAIYKASKIFIIPYLIFKMAECVLLTAGLLAFLILVVDKGTHQAAIWIIFLFLAIVALSDWYFWLCILSLYQEMHYQATRVIVPTTVTSETFLKSGNQTA